MLTTQIILGIIAVVVLVWDVLLYFDPIPDNTVSKAVREASKKWLIIPFLAGVVCGHLWPL